MPSLRQIALKYFCNSHLKFFHVHLEKSCKVTNFVELWFSVCPSYFVLKFCLGSKTIFKTRTTYVAFVPRNMIFKTVKVRSVTGKRRCCCCFEGKGGGVDS